MTFKRVVMLSVAAWAVLLLGSVLAQDSFTARLSTAPVETRNKAQVTGHGTASAVLEGRRLELSGSFEGLQGPASGAQLHMGTVKGVRGPAIHDVEVTHAANGSVSATLQLSSRQVEALRSGRVYLQIDSESAPEGNLWGWLLP